MLSKFIRPRLDALFVYEIKNKYPRETASLNNEDTIVWALRRFLSFEALVVENSGKAGGVAV
jgi:hypothetical protein